MGPVRKEQYEKNAWAWAECCDPTCITEENIKTAYRISLPRCKVGICRRNCKGNPHCLSNLGQHRWCGSSDSSDRNTDDPERSRRKDDFFVGLKNLGATCYVNSLLQLWFNNLSFRKAIFMWNPLEDPDEKTNITLDSEHYTPITIIGHLQVLFALMQYGNKKYIDPTDFIQCLRLDTSIQQDAQEFSKLFLSTIETSLSYQSQYEVQNLIKDNFCGEYSYITRCLKCSTESPCPSTFYELDLNIQGHKTIHDSLREFMMAELLQGEDRYYCAVCKEKQDALRSISLTSLPPILNLQLMRFVFDKNLGFKKKLNSFIQFPEILNMTEFLTSYEGNVEYALSAVLVHSGRGANSGHYVAHICDSASGIWYKFNDESVEEIEGKKLKLGSEDEYEMEGSKKIKIPRAPKGLHQSTNAYMLVYTLTKPSNHVIQFCNDKHKKQNWTLHPYLEQLIREKNAEFDCWVKQTNNNNVAELNNNKCMQVEMAALITLMPAHPMREEFDAITTSWLYQWLNEDNPDKEINNNKITCPHGKLDPNLISNVKYISSEMADKLFEKFGGGPRLQSSNFECLKCILNKCYYFKIKSKIHEEAKEITCTMKNRYAENAVNYWVGKLSFRSWRRLVMENVEEVCSSGEMLSDLKCFAKVSENCIGSDKLLNGDYADFKYLPTLLIHRSIVNNCGTSDKGLQQEDGQSIELSNREVRRYSEHNLSRQKSQDDFYFSSAAIDKLKQCYNQTANGNCDISYVNKLLTEVLSEYFRIDYQRHKTNLTSNKNVQSFSNNISENDNLNHLKRSNELNSLYMNLDIASDIEIENDLNSSNGNTEFPIDGINENFGNEEINCTGNITIDNSQTNSKINQPCRDSVIIKCSSITKEKKSKLNNTNCEIYNGTTSNVVNNRLFVNKTCSKNKSPDFCGINEPKDSSDAKNVSTDNINSVVEQNYSRFNNTISTQSNEKYTQREGDDNSDSGMKFNEDLLCQHGNLCVEEINRRLVPSEVWKIFKTYFPNAKQFQEHGPVCNLCKSIASEGEVAKGIYKLDASKQKEMLYDLFHDRNRPNFIQLREGAINALYLVNKEFINSWRKFIRDAGKKEPPYSIKNKPKLLCEKHSKLLYKFNDETEELQNVASIVTEQEWNELNTVYHTDIPIIITCTPDGAVITNPESCEPCMTLRLRNEAEAQLSYTRAKIYIRLINPEETELPGDESWPPPLKKQKTALSSNLANPCNNDVNQDNYNIVDGNGHNSNINSCQTNLVTREVGNNAQKIQQFAQVSAHNSTEFVIRRSARSRRKTGFKEIVVSSDLKLLDVKKKICSLLNVAPMDQHLSTEDGRYLTENSATLTELGIIPGMILNLKVDEPCDGAIAEDLLIHSTEPEAGFKGTGLLGC